MYIHHRLLVHVDLVIVVVLYMYIYMYMSIYMYMYIVYTFVTPSHTAPGTTVNIVRLLLSCLHAWSLDNDLDQSCEEILGLVRPSRPVSFGLLSKGQCLSLVLPGRLD